ncbi:UNVERIFIED_CONTAM: Protein disulfide-isomerase A5 [Gekko kuhli]
MKVDPSLKEKGVELLHYKDGTFHTEYNRALTLKSMVAFLKDPEGVPLWEEDPEAKDVVHVDSEKASITAHASNKNISSAPVK